MLDARPASRSSGRRPCPKQRGAPHLPFCASRATARAGNPLTPDAGRATGYGCALVCSTFDSTRFPAPPAWAPGAPCDAPPEFCRPVGRSLPAWAASEYRLPPSSSSTYFGQVRFRGLPSALTLPHTPTACAALVRPPTLHGLADARPCLSAVAQRPLLHQSEFDAVIANLAQDTQQARDALRVGLHPVPADCGLAPTRACWSDALISRFRTATNSENTAVMKREADSTPALQVKNQGRLGILKSGQFSRRGRCVPGMPLLMSCATHTATITARLDRYISDATISQKTCTNTHSGCRTCITKAYLYALKKQPSTYPKSYDNCSITKKSTNQEPPPRAGYVKSD